MVNIVVDEFLSLWNLSYSSEECWFFFGSVGLSFELLPDDLEFVQTWFLHLYMVTFASVLERSLRLGVSFYP